MNLLFFHRCFYTTSTFLFKLPQSVRLVVHVFSIFLNAAKEEAWGSVFFLSNDTSTYVMSASNSIASRYTCYLFLPNPALMYSCPWKIGLEGPKRDLENTYVISRLNWGKLLSITTLQLEPRTSPHIMILSFCFQNKNEGPMFFLSPAFQNHHETRRMDSRSYLRLSKFRTTSRAFSERCSSYPCLLSVKRYSALVMVKTALL